MRGFSMSNFPSGFRNGVTIRKLPVLTTYSKQVWWVDSNAQTSGHGSFERPFTTYALAIANLALAAGDDIYIKAGHAETIGSGGMASSVAGVRTIGLGSGNKRPTFTFSATASKYSITGAGSDVSNILIVNAIDQLVNAVLINANDVTLDFEYRDGSAILECITPLLTTSGNSRLQINMVYRGFKAGDSCTRVVQLAGASDVRLWLDAYGLMGTAAVELTTPASTNVDVQGRFDNGTISNLGKIVVDTVGGSLWSVSGFDGYANTSFSGGNTAAIAGDDVSAVAATLAVPSADAATNTNERDVIGNKSDTNAGTSIFAKQLVPTADATTNVSARDVIGNKTDASVYVPGTTKSIEAYVKGHADMQARTVKKTAATMVNAQVLFTIAGGPIKIEALVSICETSNNCVASTLQYSAAPTSGSAQTISAASASLANAAAGGTVTLAGTALATPALFNANGPNLMANPGTIMVPIGTITSVIGVGSTTGTWAHYLRYVPLAAGVTVT